MTKRDRSIDIKKHQKAGFFVRMVALLIDLMLIIILELAYFEVLLSINSLEKYNNYLIFYIISTIWGVIVYMLYVALFTSNFGGTFGKLLTGLRVVDLHGNFISDQRSLFRHTVGYFLSVIMVGFGYLWAINDKDRLTLHDKAAGTYVYCIDKKMIRVGVIVLLSLCSLSFYLTKDVSKLYDKNEIIRNNRIKSGDFIETEQYPGPFLREE